MANPIDARRRVTTGSELDLAIDHQQLHFFDPATGEALIGASRPSLVAS